MFLFNGKPFARYLRHRFGNGLLDYAKDRFGLPYRPPDNEDEAARRERLAQVLNLVVEATEAVARQVGEREARRLFKLAFQKPPKGKRADDKENAALLRAYDAALARGVPHERAARVAAEDMSVPKDDPELIAKQIRRLVKSRDEENASDLLWLESLRAAYGLPHVVESLATLSDPESDK